MEDLQNTPRGNRLHIGIFGRTNSGKSSLMNALIRQNYAVVSELAGTTTDPVYKSMEIHGIGPVTFIDTAGFSDSTELGKVRIEKTELALKKTDVAIIVFTAESSSDGFADEAKWLEKLREKKASAVAVLNKADTLAKNEAKSLAESIKAIAGEVPVLTSAISGEGIEAVVESIKAKIPEDYGAKLLTEGLCNEGDLVLLVMPQDIQAPKGRLILPQVQVIRELLDRHCLVHCCTAKDYEAALASLARPPALIITDSQVFKPVYDKKPESSALTSFSVIMAANKGDIRQFVEGAKAIDSIKAGSRVLIAESCTHAPLAEDIGREKIPAMLKKRLNSKTPGAGEALSIDIASGSDFPADLSAYDLIIHCGACMFNRAHVLSRQAAAAKSGVPMTNYGIAIAYLSGILDKVAVPEASCSTPATRKLGN